MATQVEEELTYRQNNIYWYLWAYVSFKQT